MNLNEILNHEIIGNAMSDSALMEHIDAFVKDDSNLMVDRCLVLGKLDDVMGVACPTPGAAEVYEYLELLLPYDPD